MEDFNIHEYIMATLKPLTIPVFFTARKEAQLPLAVFNVTSEQGVEYWDDEEQLVRYKVCINIFSRGNYLQYQKEIIKLMKNAGFKRTDVTECVYQPDSDIYNQPLFFQYIKEI